MNTVETNKPLGKPDFICRRYNKPDAAGDNKLKTQPLTISQSERVMLCPKNAKPEDFQKAVKAVTSGYYGIALGMNAKDFPDLCKVTQLDGIRPDQITLWQGRITQRNGAVIFYLPSDFSDEAKQIGEIIEKMFATAPSVATAAKRVVRLFSIGYRGLDYDLFLEKLNARKGLVNEIATVVDIRQNPFTYGDFNGDRLSQSLKALGINYVRRRDLGNPFYKDGGDIPSILAKYRENLSANCSNALESLATDLIKGKAAIMCACKETHLCHRSVVIEAVAPLLESKGVAGLWEDFQSVNKGDK